MFSCGRLLPVGAIKLGLIAPFGAAVVKLFCPLLAQNAPLGFPMVAAALAVGVCVWAGISAIVRVWADSPATDPSPMVSFGPIGVDPCRFGKKKVVVPLPP